jgi:hypothetical protein
VLINVDSFIILDSLSSTSGAGVEEAEAGPRLQVHREVVSARRRAHASVGLLTANFSVVEPHRLRRTSDPY